MQIWIEYKAISILQNFRYVTWRGVEAPQNPLPVRTFNCSEKQGFSIPPGRWTLRKITVSISADGKGVSGGGQIGADDRYFYPPLRAYRWNMSFKVEVIEKISALITAAFGLVAALAWNGAIQELFKLIFGDQSTLAAMLVYAIVVTIIAVIATIWIGRAAAKAKDEGESAAK